MRFSAVFTRESVSTSFLIWGKAAIFAGRRPLRVCRRSSWRPPGGNGGDQGGSFGGERPPEGGADRVVGLSVVPEVWTGGGKLGSVSGRRVSD